jgi:hypothetical protein
MIFVERKIQMAFGFHEVKIEEAPVGKIISLVIVGRVVKENYDKFVPQLEEYMEHEDNIRLIVELRDFTGFSAAAMWEDFKLGIKHYNNIKRLAVVGNKTWEKAMTLFAMPFTTAQVRYFDESELQKAKKWIKEDK